MEKTAACITCKLPGYNKSSDKGGHIHCRMCLRAGRASAPIGDSLEAYCEEYGGVIVNERDPPPWTIPHGIFMRPCPMIEVVVCDWKFIIHKPLLTTSSAYFERALRETFTEGHEGQVQLQLQDQDPVIFGMVSQFLYELNVDYSK